MAGEMIRGKSAPPGGLSQKPQVNLAYSATGRMWMVSACAGLGIVQSSLGDGFASLVIALTAAASAVVTELLINLKKGVLTVPDGSAVASALVLTLLLPNTIHPVFAALGAFFAMAVIKHSFGGLGANWFNPALGGWLFIRLSWPGAFGRALENSSLSVLADSLAKGFSDPQGSPLAILKINGWTGGPLDRSVSSLLNRTVFSLGGMELPEGYIDLFVSSHPGIIADRGLLALLLGTVIITAVRVSRSWVPAVYLGVYIFLIRIFGALPLGGGLGGGDILFGLCSGGTIPAAFLLSADPPTGPKSGPGALLSAFLSGVCAFVFRYRGMEPYGAFFSAALFNALVPLVRGAESRLLYARKGRSS
jgi:electron transport complex protein RnfD